MPAGAAGISLYPMRPDRFIRLLPETFEPQLIDLSVPDQTIGEDQRLSNVFQNIPLDPLQDHGDRFGGIQRGCEAEEEWEEAGRPGNRTDVIIEAAKEVGPSLFFALLVISVGFLPVFTLQAQAGRLFKPLAYPAIYMIWRGESLGPRRNRALNVIIALIPDVYLLNNAAIAISTVTA
jgi:hypothetical protein